MKNWCFLLAVFSIEILFFTTCTPKPRTEAVDQNTESDSTHQTRFYPIHQPVSLKNYLDFIDSTATKLIPSLPERYKEYCLVYYNPFILERLEATDYDSLVQTGRQIYQLDTLIVLHTTDSLFVPDSRQCQTYLRFAESLTIDVHIPAFQLRVFQADSVLEVFPVRVGQSRSRYLEMAGREVDLRTKPGIGTIVRVERAPAFINPVNGKAYHRTKRDDGKFTVLPRIPWLEPSLNGERHGQLLHPTTNPSTLGKASSNGCVGLRESHMWRLYYYAPIGTRVVFRDDLQWIDENGDTLEVEPIYAHKQTEGTVDHAGASVKPSSSAQPLPPVCYCGVEEDISSN